MLHCSFAKTFLVKSFKVNRILIEQFLLLNQPQTAITINNKMFLHGSQMVLGKIYQDRENVYAHQVLRQSMKPYHLIETLESNGNAAEPEFAFNQTILNTDTIEGSPTEIEVNQLFNNFKIIVNYCKTTNTLISNEKFHNFIQMYCSVIHLLNDEKLLEMLQLLALLPTEENVRAANFVELWNAMDAICCERIETWRTNQLLLFSDAWYNLNLARICDFVSMALRKLGRRILKMTPSELVQTMFFCNVVRRNLLEMIEFEQNLAKCVQDMSLDELGVLAMGFFKTQTPIRNPELINYLYRRLMNDMAKVQDITLASILKILRYSSKLQQADLMMELLDKIYKEKLHEISLLCCLHVALMGCELQLCHEELIESVLHRFDNELERTRLKDLERICLVIALFNIKTQSDIEGKLCKGTLNSLQQRVDEIIKFPKCFSNCLHYLSLRNYYDKNMLASTLDPKFLKHYKGTSLPISKDIFHLDTFVKINLKDDNYVGPQLSDKNRKAMGKLLTHYIPQRDQKYKLTATDKLLLDVKDTANALLQDVALKHILPNYERPDVLICYDRQQQKAIPLPSNCPEDYTGIILTRDLILGPLNNPNIDTVVIVVAGWNNVIRQRNRHTGLFDMKLTQLRLLDHKSVVIYWHEWRDLEAHKDRLNMLRRRLSTVIRI